MGVIGRPTGRGAIHRESSGSDAWAPLVLASSPNDELDLFLVPLQQRKENRYRQPVLRAAGRRLHLDERRQVEDTDGQVAIAHRRRMLQELSADPKQCHDLGRFRRVWRGRPPVGRVLVEPMVAAISVVQQKAGLAKASLSCLSSRPSGSRCQCRRSTAGWRALRAGSTYRRQRRSSR